MDSIYTWLQIKNTTTLTGQKKSWKKSKAVPEILFGMVIIAFDYYNPGKKNYSAQSIFQERT